MSDAGFHEQHVTRLERELAAVVRQHGRALTAADGPAEAIEAEAIYERIHRLLYHHLALRLGETADDWVWLDGHDNDCRLEALAPLELRASGRMWCNLPESRRQWTEPFAANIRHSRTADELSTYTIWLGSCATLGKLPTTRELIESGEISSPPPPANDDGWAFIFRMRERA